LQHIPSGFYVDVGANDPVEHSVTKSFYDAGWRGINIEPLPAFHEAFQAQRPRDINLAVAAGASEGEIVLFDVPAVNGWASPSAETAATHRADGYETVELKVPLRTLNGILAEHAGSDIHFLKIDVEGFEREVLLGLDLRRWRPWILVVEATLPNSRETNHETWEALVTDHDYLFAYFDGLNRYYVAAEHRELLAKLQVQANVFDDYVSVHLDNAWRDNAAVHALLTQAQQRLAENDAQLTQTQQRLAENEARLQELHEAARVVADNQRLADTRRVIAEARLADRTAQLDAALSQLDQLRAQLEVEQARKGVEAEAMGAALARGDELEARLHEANARCNGLEEQLRAANAWGNSLAHTLDAVHRSTSWRVSKPVRVVGRVYRRLAGARPDMPQIDRANAVALLKRTALQRLRAVAGSPSVRKYVMPPLLRIPGMQQSLLRVAIALRQNAAPAAAEVAPPAGLGDLSPRARAALADLERARRRSSNS
ncbi:FkbM family methyltransferase, partial [Massilia sp.]|uniref:FkbM family methyltransferase n=1 Tax=Massilia sp. TaxID=1882437 RepID=UPI0028AF63E0